MMDEDTRGKKGGRGDEEGKGLDVRIAHSPDQRAAAAAGDVAALEALGEKYPNAVES